MVQTNSQSAAPAPALPDAALSADGLVKVYRGGKRALDGISLSVPRGSFFGLLGPNGAGKSTFINILAGLVLKSSGTVKVWDRDIDRDSRGAKAAIGVVPQELNLDAFFTPRELLDVQAGMYGVPKSERRTMEILDIVGLADKADSYARTLSGGMRRRLLVAKAMVHNPPILVLDEPTAGVDIELRQHLWEAIRGMNEQGTTILLTTHYLEEAEQLCDRIAIINQGRLAALDTTANLLKRIDGKALLITLDRDLDTIPPELAPFAPEVRPGRKIVIRYRPSTIPVGRILESFAAAGLKIADLSTEETDLEDIFLQLTSSRPVQG